MKKERCVNALNTFKFSKKGQVTIFIILAVIIVGASALVYFLYPQIKSIITPINDPQGFIQTCMQNEIRGTITNLSLQGGVLKPDSYFSYYSNDLNQVYKVQYLCYINQYYLPCIVQQPLLQQNIESQIKNNIQGTLNSCFDELQKSYKNRGYSVSFVPGNGTSVKIIPNRIQLTFNDDLTLSKGKDTQKFTQFNVVMNSNLYELTMIANSIIDWEATYGDASTLSYMNNYPNIIVEKNQQVNGTKVYVIKDINSGEIFQFAVRGGVYPPGYA